MAQQIKKKFIQNDAVDGSKVKLLKDQSLRGQKQDGSEVELLKLDSSDKLVSGGREVGFKVDIESEKLRAEEEESRIEGKVDQEISDRQDEISRVEGLISTEQGARSQGDLSLQTAIQEEQSRASGVEQNLQSQVTVEKGRIDAILLASDADKDSFAEIVQLINSVDTESDSAFASYVLSNNQALADEVSARQSGDQSLQTAIAQEKTRAETAELAEQTARQNADSAIQADLDNLDGYAQDIRGDLDNLDGYAQDIRADLDQEILDRQNGVSGLQTSLNSEISRAQAAELEEQTARVAADLQLQTALNQEISNRQSDVNAEESRAIAEELRIEAKVDQEISDRASAVLVERNARIAGDQSLQQQVDVEKGRVDAILSASQADKDSFAEIVQLINSIDTENDSAFGSYVTSNNQALASEKSERESADEALQTAIDEEESRATGVEGQLQTAIDGKVSKSGDSMSGAYTLQGSMSVKAGTMQNAIHAGNINFSDSEYPDNYFTYGADGVESYYSDEDQAMDLSMSGGYLALSRLDKVAQESFGIMVDQGKLSLVRSDGLVTNDSFMPSLDRHATTKKYVDQKSSALSARIDALEAQTDGPFFEKQKFIIDETSELTSIELSHECIENSLVVCVGRLMAHKDEDYSVSVVGGKTVLTWMGDFAQGGSEGIESGDVIFVTFARGM